MDENKNEGPKVTVRLSPEGSGHVKAKVHDHRVTPLIGRGLVLAALGAIFLFVNLIGLIFVLVDEQKLDPEVAEDAAQLAKDQGFFTAYLTMGIIAFVILLIGIVLVVVGGYRRNKAAQASVTIK
jgi:uncharacterized membrane protein